MSYRFIVKFIKPNIESVKTGMAFKFHTQVGQTVRKGQTVMEIDVGKAILEEQAPADGKITKFLVSLDKEFPDQTPLYILEKP